MLEFIFRNEILLEIIDLCALWWKLKHRNKNDYVMTYIHEKNDKCVCHYSDFIFSKKWTHVLTWKASRSFKLFCVAPLMLWYFLEDETLVIKCSGDKMCRPTFLSLINTYWEGILWRKPFVTPPSSWNLQ